MFRFELVHKSKISRARVGRIHTNHGIIDTPGFVPVGTNATLKAVDSKLVEDKLVQESKAFSKLIDTWDAKEGIEAFKKKRKPKFK